MIEQSSVFVVSRAARAVAPEPVGAWVAQADSPKPRTTQINQRLPSNPHELMFRECMILYIGMICWVDKKSHLCQRGGTGPVSLIFLNSATISGSRGGSSIYDPFPAGATDASVLSNRND
jgi:hypothetical protein